MATWSSCKKILIIRADNMGDVLMSSPAIAAVRKCFHAELTLLTSSRGCDVAHMNPHLEHVINFDMPWVKTNEAAQPDQIHELVALLKDREFDGCIIFTVYSQNPLPSAMLAYMAGIPLRLAYCRENPYGLLTDWLPDLEPYSLIRHQVIRDCDLVRAIGANCIPKKIDIKINADVAQSAIIKLGSLGIQPDHSYLIINPSVSETKRKLPQEYWISIGKALLAEYRMPILITGSVDDQKATTQLADLIGNGAVPIAGLCNLEEFAVVISNAAVVVSVNTGTVHLASAVQTPVVVLYAQTNPQHKPWMVPNVVFEFSISQNQKSKNTVIDYVDRQRYRRHQPLAQVEEVILAVRKLLKSKEQGHDLLKY